jgi:uncharacterized protein (DUF58 family)
MRLRSLYEHLKPPRGFRLTKPGRIFFAFLVCLIIVAMVTGNNLLFLMLSGMLSFMIISGIESERNIRYIELERVLPAEIYARIPAKIGYLIRNKKKNSFRLLLRDLTQLKLGKLRCEEMHLINTEIMFPGRGEVHLGRISISTTYPYGLFEKSIPFPADQDIIVFPEPLDYSPSITSGPDNSGNGKNKESVSHVRAYIPGDPLSSIVWKKQSQGLVSRVSEGGAGMNGVVVVLPGADIEQRLSRATYVISELHKSCCPFGLAVNEFFSGIASTRAHKIEILKQLALTHEIRQPGMKDVPPDAQLIYI